MQTEFIAITDLKDLDNWLTLSMDEHVIIFKHSTTCPISAAAYKEMSKLSEKVGLVVVQRSRDVSSEVEARTGIGHESPQAIIVRNRKSVWSASHGDVTSDGLAKALLDHR